VNPPNRTLAAAHIRQALDGLEKGCLSDWAIHNCLELALYELTGKWWAAGAAELPTGEDGGDGGYVPADDKDATKLADTINAQLADCRYMDGETPLGGPYRIWARAILWYSPPQGNTVLLIKGNRVEQAPVINALLNWGTTSPSSFLPPYPGPKVGWRFNNIRLGSDAVLDAWLTDGGVAVQQQ